MFFSLYKAVFALIRSVCGRHTVTSLQCFHITTRLSSTSTRVMHVLIRLLFIFPIGSSGGKRSERAHWKVWRKGELRLTHTNKQRHMHIHLHTHKHTPGCLIKYGWMRRPSWNWLLLFTSRWQAIWCSEKRLSGRGCFFSLHSHPQRASWES